MAKTMQEYRGIRGVATSAAVDRVSQSLFAIASNQQLGAWSIDTGIARWHRRLSRWPVFGASRQIVGATKNGDLVVAHADDKIEVYDSATGALSKTTALRHSKLFSFSILDRHLPHYACISCEANRLAIGRRDGFVEFWDYRTGDYIGSLDPIGSSTPSVVLSHDARLCVVGSDNGDVSLYHIDETVKRYCLLEPEAFAFTGVRPVAFSPKESLIASGTMSGDVVLWDTRSRNVVLRLVVGSQDVDSVAFSPDGLHIAAIAIDGICRVWRIGHNQVLGDYDTRLGRRFPMPRSVILFPDNCSIIAACSDKVFRRWLLSDEVE